MIVTGVPISHLVPQNYLTRCALKQFLWTLLVMALVGNMIADSFSGNPATVNYAMFVSAFSMFSLFYLVPASFNLDWAIHPIIMIVLDTLNAIFFLTAGIALAARLEAHSCSNNVRVINEARDLRCTSIAAGFMLSADPPTIEIHRLIVDHLGLHSQQRDYQWLRAPRETLP